jgi:potassium efflux system protein
LPALQGFNEVKIPGTAVSLSNALFGLLVLIMTLLAARNLPGLLEFTVLQKLPFDAGERYAITTISRYTITLVGVLWVLRVAGIEWSSLQWTAAGLSLGIGFGLQEIVANFISGLIILFEQPVRVGDIVTVAGIDGRVTRIRMRATTIADWDRRELVVPNKEFVTGSIVNWTLSDPVTRLVIPVGIAYGSDTALARTILLRVARENSFVQVEPTPSAIFRGFGDSTLNFELRIFIPTRDVWPQVVDDLHTRIDLEFRKSGIEIAFPQRDLHIRSAEPLARAMLEARREREKQESGEPWRTKGGGDAPK